MKRTTIFIDEALERDLRALARRRGRPVAGMVREAIATYVSAAQEEGARLPRFAAVGRSGRRDVAERHESLLFQEIASARGAAPASARGGAPARVRRRRKPPAGR
jgi:predicted transcriptional regulator